MKYGDYIIGMNSSTGNEFSIELPSEGRYVNLTDGGVEVKSNTLKVKPMTTLVLFKNKK